MGNNRKKMWLGRLNKVVYLLLSIQMILISVLPMLPPISAAEADEVVGGKVDNGNSKSFVTTESTSSTQTQTFIIPGLKKLNGSTVNTGNVEVTSVVGEEVTVRLKDGVHSRQEQTGGIYTPESTQTESDSRTNTTGSFPVNITKNNITLSKDGSATSVQTGGSYDPGGTKYNWHGNGVGLLGYTNFVGGSCGDYSGCINWQFSGNTPNNTVFFTDSDGYSGNLVIQKWYWEPYSGFFGQLYEMPPPVLGQTIRFPNISNFFAPNGTLTKPAKDTRTYNYTQKYKGTKIIPATDTRTYQDYYQYEVMFDFEGDITPPTIGLTANPTELTNQDVTISADIKDVENTTLITDEGTNSTHIQTFKIPHMKKVDMITVDTGTVEVVSVDGDQVTVKMKDGVPIRREVTGGNYTPAHTMFVTNQTASYYNSGGYTGYLTAYQTSEEQEYASHILRGYNEHRSSGWQGVVTNFEYPETYRYNIGGVVGYIPISKVVSGDWYTFETNIYRQDVTVTYGGYATKLPVTRYQGNVTKPAIDTRTYKDTYQYAVTFEYEKDIPIQKWAKGNHPVSHFSDNGNVFTVKSFKVTEKGTYTVFTRDSAGNESVKSIAISNIDKVAPVITLTPNISLPTNKNIIVIADITDDTSISEKKWAAGSRDVSYFASSGTTLGASFEVNENGTFTVYAKDAAGNESVQMIKITNIDRLAPVISLTASPTTLTATDVTITADIRDLDNGLFKTPESTSITQTHTFTLPGLKKLNKALVDTGNVEILDVTGENVTIKASGGSRTRQEQTGGSYTAADTKAVTGQAAAAYSDSDGYEGLLNRYLFSGSFTPESIQIETDTRTSESNSFPTTITKNGETLTKDGSVTSVQTGGSIIPSDTKYVTGQTSANYNSEGYVGTLSQYLYSGSYQPGGSQNVSGLNIRGVAYTAWWTVGGDALNSSIRKWFAQGYENKYYEPQYYKSGNYEGYLRCNNYTNPIENPSLPDAYNYDVGYTFRDLPTYATLTNCTGTISSNGTDTRVYRYQGNVTKQEVDTRTYNYTQKYKATKIIPAVDTRVYLYQGDVTKPAADTRTYDDYYQYEISLDYEKDVLVQKWTKGNQFVEFFKNAGKEFEGSTFIVSENDTYTVYAKDAAGNEVIETINVSNIDKKPAVPKLSASPMTPTNENVTVEITYSDNSVVKQYRVDSGVWTNYTEAISITKNGTVEAKGQNTTGEWSEIGSISISNIDKTAPDISLSASPTTLTSKDVTITAEIGDPDKVTFKTSESKSINETHTFTLPGLKKFNKASVNTGNVKVVNVDGDKVTVNVSGGASTRKEETGGVLIPAVTKYVTGQLSPSYNVDGYIGNLQMYLYSTNNIPGPSKELVSQYYGEGWATALYTNTTWEPMRITSITQHFSQGPTPYSDAEGYTGTVQITAYAYGDNCYSHNYGVDMQCAISYNLFASGIVSKPGTVSNVYRYQGNVTKPAVDTRTYDEFFQYEITFDYEKDVPVKKWAKGDQSKDYFKSNGKSLSESTFKVSENAIYTVYARDVAGNDTVETITIKNIDDIPPTIKLTANPTTPTNEDVTITAEIEDTSSIDVTKWASGSQNMAFFKEGGNQFIGSSFMVSENGTYTVYAKDEVGNESIQTISITNIDRIPPATPILTASTSGPTNGSISVTITYPSDASVKQYRINGGAWTLYTSIVSMIDIGIVEARGQDTAGNWSEIGSITISNIDTNAPVITLTANPTTPTNQDVTISADIKDNEKRKVITSESIVSTQTETFTIPGLKELKGAKANTGKVEIVSIDGEKVTVKVSEGSPSGKKHTGGSFTPADTKFVTNQASTNYNSGGYTGLLSRYLHSTISTPAETESFYEYTMGWPDDKYLAWGGPNGVVYRFWTGSETVDLIMVGSGGNMITWRGVKTVKPAVETPVYRYQGNVTKPAEDTRTYTDTYKYEVTFDYEAEVPVQKWAKGNQSVEFFKNGGTTLNDSNFKVSENDTYTVYAQDLAGNETVETINIGNIDRIPPTIILSQTPERPVNVDITIRADITDNVEIAEKKYAVGTRDAEYFSTAGENLPGNKFIVTDNGAYTVYAQDTAGNETVETITISNIDRVEPEKATFSLNPSTPTNQDVLVTILYPSDAFEKEYKIGENGVWRLYREPVKLVNNNSVFARSKDRAENISEESSIEVTNIDKTPPTIILTDAATESHVVITADISDVGSGIEVKKYAAGRRASSFFATEGTILSGNTFNVTENGTYTVYAKDRAGNETVRTIAVIKMPITSPNPNPNPDPIPNPNPGTCVSGPNGNASGGGLSFTGCSPEKINTVTVHTPVVMYARASDDKEHDQRTNPPERSTPANPNKDRHAFILDRPFTVKLPTSGQHLDTGLAPGYGDRDFLKYVEEKEVKFPFDVYTETKEGFYPKDTWIKIPKSNEASTFYLPVWVPEGQYTVDYRSIAINAPGAKPQDVPKNNLSEGMQEHHANLNLDYRTPNEVMQHHIAYDTIEVDVVGRLYDFRVTDILDYQWSSVFRKQEGLMEHTGNSYWVGKNSIDGELRGNEDPFVLPIRQGSHPEGYKNVAVKTGYQFKFDMKTKGDMSNANDAIRITPSFYFVNKDGTGRRPVDVYYHSDSNYFVQIGSDKDVEYRKVTLNEPLRNVEKKQLADTADYYYRLPEEYGFGNIIDKYINPDSFKRDYERKISKQEVQTGPYSWQILNWKLRTLTGPDANQVPSNATLENPKNAKAHEQMWYGEYSLPADIYVVDPDLHPDISGYGTKHRLNRNSPVFLQDGYVIVNFNIETIDNADKENPRLQYHKGPLNNQWKMEGFNYNFVDPYERNFDLIDGDVMFYHGDQSSLEDFSSKVTH